MTVAGEHCHFLSIIADHKPAAWDGDCGNGCHLPLRVL